MIVTAVIEPDALDRALFKADPMYGAGARTLFDTLLERGVLLVDPDKRMLGQLVERVTQLPTQHGQWIGIALEHLLKNKRRRLVECSSGKGAATVVDAALAVAQAHEPDGLVCHPDHIDKAREVVDSPSAITPDLYLTSGMHAARCRLAALPSHLHHLGPADVGEVLSRPLKHATRLRFYDKQIGKGSNTAGFKRGLAYLLDLWHQSSDYADGGSVEVYTLAKHYVPPERDASVVPQELREIGDAMDKVQREIVAPLEARFGNPISLHVKQADPEDVHARYLQAGSILIHFDRGFDFLKSDGAFKKGNPVKLDLTAFDDADEFRRLPDTRRA